MNWILIVVCSMFGILGGLLLLNSVAFTLCTLWLLKCGRRVTATVVGYRDKEEAHTPVFHFEDENGELQETEGMGTPKKRFRAGELVAMIFWPDNPQKFMVDHFTDKWGPALIAFGVAMVLWVFPGICLFVW
jgi:hypothetical protein